MKNGKRLLPALAGLALLACAVPRAFAWDGTGHLVSAEIAYEHLTPKTKAAVDALLRHHRDYALWMRERPAGYADRGRFAFMKAATWPDDVRKTPNDRPNWHYIDLPVVAAGYVPDPAALVVPTLNAETQIVAETARLTAKTVPDPDRAVALCWVEHLVGDIHQPLHTASLFSARFPHGDRGGNDETLAPDAVDNDPLETAANPHKLHALWDDLLGTTRDPAEIQKIAVSLEAQPDIPSPQRPFSMARDLPQWIAESHALALPYVYCNGTLPMTAVMGGMAEVSLPPGYLAVAHTIANRQIARAGLRLAALLNAQAF